jgi:excisionase family DNA binding protein
MAYLTTSEFAEKVGVSRTRVQQWIMAGRIPKAIQVGGYWGIPENTPAPEPLPAGRPKLPTKAKKKKKKSK